MYAGYTCILAGTLNLDNSVKHVRKRRGGSKTEVKLNEIFRVL